jgi:hypothetical protein
MKVSKISFLTAIFTAVAALAGTGTVSSWDAMENSLIDLQMADFTFAEFSRCAAYKDLVASGDVNVLLEMTRQKGQPLVQLGGFLALEPRSDAVTLDAGLELILGAEHVPQEVLWPVYMYVQAHGAEAVSRLRCVGRTGPPNTTEFAALLRFLPLPELHKWFATDQTNEVCLSYLALVLDRLMDESKDVGLPVTDKMNKVLDICGSVPGEPRCVYCLWTSEKDPKLVERMRLLLADKALEDLLVGAVVNRHRTMLSQMDLSGIEMSDRRKQVVAELLKPKPTSAPER